MPEGVVNTITPTGQGSGQYGLYNKYNVVINGQNGSWIIGADQDPKLQVGESVTYTQLAQNGQYFNWKGVQRAVPGTAQAPTPPPAPPIPPPQPKPAPQPAPQPAKTGDTQLSINRAVALKAAVALDGHITQIDAQVGNARTRRERVRDVLSMSEDLLRWVLYGDVGPEHRGQETTQAPPIEVYEDVPDLTQF